MKDRLLIIISLVFGLLQACTNSNSLFEQLTTDHLVNPIGIESSDPSFSWIVQASGNSKEQSAYHILVATSPDLLDEDKADMWNSEEVKSAESVSVRYAGKNLESMTRYWWCVKFADQEGTVSAWSEPQYFEMGLLNERDWKQAQWISLETDTRTSEYRFRELQTARMEKPDTVVSIPAGYFRKEVKLDKKINEARAYICGLGYYEFYLNGGKVGDHVLDPAPTSYDHHALYVSYDITAQLKKGDNTLGVILGNGFYGQSLGFNAPFLLYGKPAFRLMLNLVYADGTKEEVISDVDWKASSGPIVFDNVYGGETYDARHELGDWKNSSYDDSQWQEALIAHPEVAGIRSQLLPPIRKVEELKPVDIFEAANGNWIVDFGQNISGWVKVRVKEEAGTVIRLSSVEALTRKGDAIHPGSLGKSATGFNQLDVYVCKGKGVEEWEPRFTYNGFQYTEIAGLSKKPDPADITAVVVYNDLQETGRFTCSDTLLNKMIDVTKWTVLDNMHGFPEDCPAREKCGWLGDAHATAQFNLYSFDMAHLYQKYMDDIESQLLSVSGADPTVDVEFKVPSMIAPGRRRCGTAHLDWHVAQVYLPWYLYLNYGDIRAIEEHYEEMKQLVSYQLTFRNEKGIIENGLGDWCPPRWDRQENPDAMECHPYVSGTAYFYDVLGIMIRAASLLEEQDYARELWDLRKNIGRSFNQVFLEDIGENVGKWYGSQTATVMALQFGMVPEDILEDVEQGLLYDIRVNHIGHHSTGIHGNRYLYTVLSAMGEEELAYSVLTHPEYPSQAFILNNGLTTWPERQFEWDNGREWDRSLNHPMQGGFAAFFYESVAGIRPDPEHPGYKEFIIQPSFFRQLEHAGAEIHSPYGKVISEWHLTGNQAELVLVVPFNTRAKVILPPEVILTEVYDLKAGEIVPVEEEKGEDFSLSAGEYSVRFELQAVVEHPDIIYLFTDQQSATMMSCAGNEYVHTPAIDYIAENGIRFTRAYSTNPVCSPARVSLMTGRFPGYFDDSDGKQARENVGSMRIPQVSEEVLNSTLPAYLKKAGYDLIYGGKEHLPPSLTPTSLGFKDITNNEREVLAEKAAAVIRSRHDKPYFMVVSLINPHDICYMAIRDHVPPNSGFLKAHTELTMLDSALQRPDGVTDEEFWARYAPPLPPNFEPQEGEPEAILSLLTRRDFRIRTREDYTDEQWRMHRYAYARLTEDVDSQVQIIMDALKESGKEGRTLVLFASDHGDMDAAHRMEHKTALYEEAANIPFLAMWKGQIPAGKVDETHLVSSGLDLLPTVCDYAGADGQSDPRGRSLRPLLEGKETDWRKYLGVESEIGRMVVSEDKLKYIRYDAVGIEERLHDLNRDPYETSHFTDDADYFYRMDELRKSFDTEWFPGYELETK